ncbi:excreted virulence factor EspC (type VII ESX diderm) [Amycolatopsis sulphurea]|uniref:Excreted virulence factor EspC (Type VII ESX diderm) n=1 Tax=Amycolatopsis sulphurea TaxID=76022 RepID=A0A2A9FBV7_9PSEU|nr:type VII secretion target [Amycolatopsis sulphurea]PFG47919.1 excreted virulence factor EspC (type VII ESX diderm) [Amycolatopsis sulphurea]
MGFTTVPETLRGARSAAGEKVGSLRGADCAEPVGRVAGAVQGGSAAAAAAHCQDALSTTFTEWRAEAQRLTDHLGVAADRYQQGDHAAAGVFPSAAPTMHGPR